MHMCPAASFVLPAVLYHSLASSTFRTNDAPEGQIDALLCYARPLWHIVHPVVLHKRKGCRSTRGSTRLGSTTQDQRQQNGHSQRQA